MRNSIQDFSLANPIYVGATVTAWTVAAGVKTATKATLYAGATGTATLTNPQSLDSDGKFQQPVYIDDPVIMTVSGLSIADHDTGIVQSVLAAGQLSSVYEDLAAANGVLLVGNAADKRDLASTTSGKGAALVGVQDAAGFFPGTVTQVEQALQMLGSSHVVSVKDPRFGAVGDGITDDSAAIQAADTYCGANGKVLNFDGVDYLIKSQITISAPWRGVPRKTQIIIAADMVYATTFDPRTYSAITNKNMAVAYNASTADNVDIQGIDFLARQVSAGTKQILAFANVKGGALHDAQLRTNTTSLCVPLDLFACVKNFKLDQVHAVNTTGAAAGGGCWIRNITSDGSNATNDSENIVVENSYFGTSSVDEALAIYGVNGKVKNVRVRNCTFKGEASAVKHGTLMSIFPLGSTANAAIEDVVLDANRFETSNYINHVLKIGDSADTARICKNVKVSKNTFIVSLPAAGTSYVARNIRCVGGNIKFADNTIDATGTANSITTGVDSFDSVARNHISGTIGTAAAFCTSVRGNEIKSLTGIGAQNCSEFEGNEVDCTGSCFLGTSAGPYNIRSNKLTTSMTSGAAVNFNSVAGSAPSGDIEGNRFILSNAATYAINHHASAGRTRVLNNTASGTGNTLSGSNYTEVGGNDWYGALDTMQGLTTYNPPSLADGVGTTTTITVTGAVGGDFVTTSFGPDLQGVTVTAWVSAPDTVSVRFQNETGGTLDLAAGTLYAQVIKRW